MAKGKDARTTPEEVQAEVDAMVRPLADYLVEHSNQNMPMAHNAGRLLRDASAAIVTVANTPLAEADNELPPEAVVKMAPLYEKNA